MERYFIRWRKNNEELGTTIEDRTQAEQLRDAIVKDEGAVLLEFTKKGLPPTTHPLPLVPPWVG